MTKPMVRREFLLAAGAGLAISGSWATARVLGANDRVRVGLIGAGGRGMEIFSSLRRCPNTEAVAVADVYTRRLEEVKSVVPGIKTFRDFRKMLEDPNLDAVLIATPQHQHALNFVPAIQAGKDVYVEKTMAFDAGHAKRMRAAYRNSKSVVQVGIQSISTAAWARAQSLARPDLLGEITAIHSHMYRNAPYGGWLRPIPSDCDEQHVDWKLFEGDARPLPFDPDRYVNWRFYWDYSGGNVFENMVHQVGFWYKALNLRIPRSVTMSGANFLSPKMQPPDTMDVSMEQPENLLFTWNSGFYNLHYGLGETVLGRKGTLVRDQSADDRPDHGIRFVPEGRREEAESAEPAASAGENLSPDIVGGGDSTDLHMQNFIDCVRSRKEPNCSFDIGFRSAIAARMAVTSYLLGRTVKWDAQREEIV